MTGTEPSWQALAEAALDLQQAQSTDDLAVRGIAAARHVIRAASVELTLAPRAPAEHEALEALARSLASGHPAAVVVVRGTLLDAWRDAIVAAGLTPPATAWLAAPLRGHDGALLGVLHAADREDAPGLEADAAAVDHLARAMAVTLDRLFELGAAQRASRARDELVAMVSHDLRNPLNTIAMGLTLLERAPEMGAHAPILTRLRRGTTRLNRLIGDLLDVTRIEAGTLVVDRAPLAPSAAIDEVVDLLGPQAGEKGIRLEVAVPAHAPMVLADRDRLVQVLMNLIGNAIKFTPERGVVAISAVRHGDHLRFEVRDTGSGIPEGDLPFVFDRFWQARSTATQGTGLGLFIAKGIVHAHGGSMQIESAEGLGTCIAFTIGVAPDAPRAARPSERHDAVSA